MGKENITLASLTRKWKRSLDPGAFGLCSTYSRLGTCSDMNCPSLHRNSLPKRPTMRDVYAARRAQKKSLQAKKKFSPRVSLPGEGYGAGKGYLRCLFCRQYELWHDSEDDHKCDVKKRLPADIVREVRSEMTPLPGFYEAIKYRHPAQVWLLDRPYLLKRDWSGSDEIYHYETRERLGLVRGKAKKGLYYVRIYNGWGYHCLVSKKQFETEFKKLDDNLEPNGWGGVQKKGQDTRTGVI